MDCVDFWSLQSTVFGLYICFSTDRTNQLCWRWWVQNQQLLDKVDSALYNDPLSWYLNHSAKVSIYFNIENNRQLIYRFDQCLGLEFSDMSNIQYPWSFNSMWMLPKNFLNGWYSICYDFRIWKNWYVDTLILVISIVHRFADYIDVWYRYFKFAKLGDLTHIKNRT